MGTKEPKKTAKRGLSVSWPLVPGGKAKKSGRKGRRLSLCVRVYTHTYIQCSNGRYLTNPQLSYYV